jgi:alanine-glyoxylate transaminase/serine-glyoxylate transaminase/serine-pyruvate transaminase
MSAPAARSEALTIPAPVDPPRVTLLGPGPSETPPEILAALAKPTLGHLDPRFLAIMDQISEMLRTAFGTQNRTTLPISGTGSAGMETCVMNLVEPGDAVLVGVNGVFGGRLCEVASRAGGEVTRVEAPWGQALSPSDFTKAAAGRKFKVLCVVHAETSTGVLQDLSGFREVADALGAFLLVDTVTSLGGVAIELDRFGVDAAYSGTQKCLSCPPGLAPVSFSDRAVAHIHARTSPVRSWYMDIGQLTRYWGGERAYHHTAPINMLYGLHEALRLALVEGLPARFARHRLHAGALAAGLGAMGLSLPVPEAVRLPPLTLVRVGEGIDEAAVRRRMLQEHATEIGGGLGDFKGKAWRIGLMGASSSRRHVEGCLAALTESLSALGNPAAGDGVGAAQAFYTDNP